MSADRFDRQVRFFGRDGQAKLRAARVAVVGVGGLGTHVVQQLALLGVGELALIDSEELAESNRNRYVGARHDDSIPGTQKVLIGERLTKEIDSTTQVVKIPGSLVRDQAFAAVIGADYAFGCLDSEGARLVLNELCAAYARPYFDLASDIVPGEPLTYGGRVCVAWDGNGCLVCYGLLDVAEAQAELAGPEGRRAREALYGVQASALDRAGPSVVSINGVVASLAVTEFVVAVTGLRRPQAVSIYRGNMGRVTVSSDPPAPDCYYCRGIRGRGDAVDVQRYIRAGVGAFLR
jgi:hypothetical protein